MCLGAYGGSSVCLGVDCGSYLYVLEERMVEEVCVLEEEWMVEAVCVFGSGWWKQCVCWRSGWWKQCVCWRNHP